MSRKCVTEEWLNENVQASFFAVILHHSYVINIEFGCDYRKWFSLFPLSSINGNYNNKELNARILSVHRIISLNR